MQVYVTYKAQSGQSRAVIHDGHVFRLLGGMRTAVNSDFAEYLRATVKGTPQEQLFDFSFQKESMDLSNMEMGSKYIQENVF